MEMKGDFDTPQHEYPRRSTRGISLQFARNSLFRFKSQDSEQHLPTAQENNEPSFSRISPFSRFCSSGCCYSEDSNSNVNFDEDNFEILPENRTSSIERLSNKFLPKSTFLQKHSQQKHEGQKHKFIPLRLQNILHLKKNCDLQQSCENNNNDEDDIKSIEKLSNIQSKVITDCSDSNILYLSNSKSNQRNEQRKKLNDKTETNFINSSLRKQESGPVLRYQSRLKCDEELVLTVDNTINKTSTNSNQSTIENDEISIISPQAAPSVSPLLSYSDSEHAPLITSTKELTLPNIKKLSRSKPAHVEIELESVKQSPQSFLLPVTNSENIKQQNSTNLEKGKIVLEPTQQQLSSTSLLTQSSTISDESNLLRQDSTNNKTESTKKQRKR